MPLLKALVLCTIMAATPVVSTATPNLQAHLRTGYAAGSFAGSTTEDTVSGSFSSVTALDMEFEYFLNNKTGIATRATILSDQTSGQIAYTYMGMAYKHYFFSHARYIETMSTDFTFSLQPRWRYYVQGDAGISNVQIEQLTQSLATESTLIELGTSVGVIRQFSKGIGIEGQLSVSKGVPISNVPVDSLVYRLLIGITSYF